MLAFTSTKSSSQLTSADCFLRMRSNDQLNTQLPAIRQYTVGSNQRTWQPVHLYDSLFLVALSLDFTFKDVCAIIDPSRRDSCSRPSGKRCQCAMMKSLKLDKGTAQLNSPPWPIWGASLCSRNKDCRAFASCRTFDYLCH